MVNKLETPMTRRRFLEGLVRVAKTAVLVTGLGAAGTALGACAPEAPKQASPTEAPKEAAPNSTPAAPKELETNSNQIEKPEGCSHIIDIPLDPDHLEVLPDKTGYKSDKWRVGERTLTMTNSEPVNICIQTTRMTAPCQGWVVICAEATSTRNGKDKIGRPSIGGDKYYMVNGQEKSETMNCYYEPEQVVLNPDSTHDFKDGETYRTIFSKKAGEKQILYGIYTISEGQQFDVEFVQAGDPKGINAKETYDDPNGSEAIITNPRALFFKHLLNAQKYTGSLNN